MRNRILRSVLGVGPHSMLLPRKAIQLRRWFFFSILAVAFCFMFCLALFNDEVVDYEQQVPLRVPFQNPQQLQPPGNMHSQSQPNLLLPEDNETQNRMDQYYIAQLNSIVVLKNQSKYSGNFTIPRIFHQTWDDTRVPGQAGKWMTSWQRENPHFQYWFWTDTGARRLIEEKYIDSFSKLYDDYPHKINRADLRRLFILYAHGGIFADLDMECLRPLGDLLSQYECILSQEPEEHQALFYDNKHHNYALTGFMACRPHHPFFKLLLHMLPKYARNARSNHWNDNILNSTGPMFVSEVVKLYVEKYNNTQNGLLHIAPPDWFMPTFDPVHNDQFFMTCTKPDVPLSSKQKLVCDRLIARKFSNIASHSAYTNHHWLHSWAHMFIPQGYWDVKEILKSFTLVDS